MPDPGFKDPISSSSLNIFNFQPPSEVVTSNPGFGKRTTYRSYSIYNPKPFNHELWSKRNTQNRKSIKTRTKYVNLEDDPKLAKINFTNGDPTDELYYQNQLQELYLAPKVVAVVSNGITYKLAEFLEKKIPITPTTDFYYESLICEEEIFNPVFGNYREIFKECLRFFYRIANLVSLILSDMKNGNLCRDPITGDLKAIDFEPRFIVNIKLLKNKSIKRSYIIFMLFQLYISLILYGTHPLIQFSETNISKKDFNKMIVQLVATRRTNPCLRNLYHYSGLLLAGDDIYDTMMAQPPDKAVAFTKNLIKDQINGVRPDIDTSFLDDDTASTQITQGAGKRRTKKRRSAK